MSDNRIELYNKNYSYILAIAECHTLSAAAEKLYISQPALSRFVKNLEQRIDLPLFDRIDNRLILTQAGKEYVEYARRITGIEQAMTKEIERMRNESRKFVRIGIPDHWASYIIPPLVVTLQRMLPNIQLEIKDVRSDTLEKLLLNADADVILSRFPSEEPAITSKLLRSDAIYLAAPAEVAARLCTDGVDAAGVPCIDLQELAGLQYVLQNPGQSIRKCVDRLFADLSVEPDVKMLCRSVEASMRMAGAGVGCCFVSSIHRQHIDMVHTPVYYAIDHPCAVLPLHISYLSGRTLPKHMQQVIDQIPAVI